MKRTLSLLMTLSLAWNPLLSQEQVAPAPIAPPAVVTVGEFAIRAASGLGLQPPQGGFTPESAAWSLVQKGVRIRPELAAPLTEADAVETLVLLGYRIRTTTPSRVVSRDRFEILCGAFFRTREVPSDGPEKPRPEVDDRH